MRCPHCGHLDDRVVDSRLSRDGTEVRRRRECSSCGQRYTTRESISERPLSVRKREGAVEPFDRNKLVRSIQIACAKRPISLSEIEEIADSVVESLERSESGELESRAIGEAVMGRLKDLDQVAFVRFASVYRNFQDTEEFLEEVRTLLHQARYNAREQLDLLRPTSKEP
jgi:transcriptional repressor NrdR